MASIAGSRIWQRKNLVSSMRNKSLPFTANFYPCWHLSRWYRGQYNWKTPSDLRKRRARCEWDDRLGIGNPVYHPSVKQYLRPVKEEQAKARSPLKKAIPMFLDKLEKLAVYIFAQLSTPRILPITLFTLSRDLCFFTLDFFSGDRFSDLGRVMLKETLFPPRKIRYFIRAGLWEIPSGGCSECVCGPSL